MELTLYKQALKLLINPGDFAQTINIASIDKFFHSYFFFVTLAISKGIAIGY